LYGGNRDIGVDGANVKGLQAAEVDRRRIEVGKPVDGFKTGAVLLAIVLLIRNGGFSESWSSLPIRSRAV
jgi:hypothetical protein